MDLVAYKYVDAVLPKKFRICGLELKPFSLGHYLLLEKSGNPFINPTAEETSLSDSIYYLFHALLVCALTFENNILVQEDDKAYSKLTIEFFDNLKKNIESDKNWNIVMKIKEFENYMKYHMDMPIYTEENCGDSGVPSGTDWKQTIFIVFKKMGYTDSEILNMNFKKLFYEWTSWAEGEGGIKVMNKIDLEQLKKLKKGKK